MNWLLTWMSNPSLLIAGSLAMAAPILIHLLNKRKFKVVDWAAMDFLFAADKKNRRRIQLENFILLLLRCLALLLLGLMLAKPFLPSMWTGRLGQSPEFQRTVLLDDSHSLMVRTGNQTVFTKAKDQLKQLLQRLANDQNVDYLTLFVTSQMDSPQITNELVNADTLAALLDRVDRLTCSEQVADYAQSLQTIQDYISETRTLANQVLYVISDFRQRDWMPSVDPQDTSAPSQQLANLEESLEGIVLVDLGSPLENNLVISDFRAEDLLVSGTIARFQITVTNYGKQTAEDVAVRFRVGDFQPQEQPLPPIAPGQSQTISFRHLFPSDVVPTGEREQISQQKMLATHYRLSAEIVEQVGGYDDLVEDSTHLFAAQVLNELPVLLVDGDPSAISERSETYYLRNIGLPGTGLRVTTATAPEFETISLSEYKVIFLCNLDEISADRREALWRWVQEGGGLVLMPGDRVRASTFNENFYNNGQGLSPAKLTQMHGDVTFRQWVHMEITDPDYPALRVTKERDAGLRKVEIFSWWGLEIAPKAQALVSVPLRLTDELASPAVAEQTRGRGRVVTFAFSADADWSMWVSHPTYVPVMWDLCNDLTTREHLTTNQYVGGRLQTTLDLSRYHLRVSLVGPDEDGPDKDRQEVTAAPFDKTDSSQQSVLYQAQFESIPRSGFYTLEMQRLDDETDRRLFAVNIDPREGDLKRLPFETLPKNFFGRSTQVVHSETWVTGDDQQAYRELWYQILWLLVFTLGTEQFLGWWFGRHR